MLGTVLLASQLSPTYISPRFKERVERLARYALVDGTFKEVGVTDGELETDSMALTPRERAIQAEYCSDYARTVQFSPAISVNEWWGRILRRVLKPRGPLVELSGEDIKANRVEGSGWQVGRGWEGKMVEGASPGGVWGEAGGKMCVQARTKILCTRCK